jgi:hypothetical protein
VALNFMEQRRGIYPASGHRYLGDNASLSGSMVKH